MTWAELRSWVNTKIISNGAGLIDATAVRTSFLELITNAEGIVTSWLTIGTTTAPTSNTDNIYRTGKVLIGSNTQLIRQAALQVAGDVATSGGIYAYTSQNNTAGMATQPFSPSKAGIQVVSGADNNAAYMDFHVPGVAVHQFGVDIDGKMKLRPWNTSTAYDVLLQGFNDKLSTSNVAQNRKVVVSDPLNNDHQFTGLGLNTNILRYQIEGASANHVWYVGTSAVTSSELMRLTGAGRLGIGTSSPGSALDVINKAGDGGIVARLTGVSQQGTLTQLEQTGVAVWQVGLPANVDAFIIKGWSGGSQPEYMRIDTAGLMGLSTNAPTSRLDINGAAGHNQLRLRTSYTPTGSADTNGQLGQIAWDTNYIYAKTSGGWRRSALSSW